MLTMFDIGLAFGAVMFACGYYLGERGLQGVKNDMNNIKTDVEVLKNKVAPSAPPVTQPV